MSFYSILLRILPLTFLRIIAKVAAYFINQNPDKSMLWKTRINIGLAYPTLSSEQKEQLARESVTKQCLSYIESGKCWAMPPEWSIQQIRTVHNLEVLTNALSDPRGALIITPHLGTWEMMNAWVNQYGTPTIMYKPMKDSGFNAFALHARQRLNATLVPTDANGVKALFKNLKQGGFSVIFFGIPCLTSTLASKMAQKTQCRLVGLSCFRREDGEGFDVYCDDLNDQQLYDRDIEVATTALNQAVEQMINRFPAEYMWGYKRFKNNTDDIYFKK